MDKYIICDNQLYFKFYNINNDNFRFIKFISRINRFNQDNYIYHCYNFSSKSNRIYNDLYGLRCKYILDFKLNLRDIKSINGFKFYINISDVNKIKNLLNEYIKFLTKNNIDYNLNDNILKINYNGFIYDLGYTFEQDKIGFVVYNWLNLDIKFYKYILDNINLFNFDYLSYNDIKIKSVNKIFRFNHSKRIKYFKRKYFNQIINGANKNDKT